jgi:uncharacterized protein
MTHELVEVGRVDDVAVEDHARDAGGADVFREGRTSIHIARHDGVVLVALSTPRGSFVARLSELQAEQLAAMLRRAREGPRTN